MAMSRTTVVVTGALLLSAIAPLSAKPDVGGEELRGDGVWIDPALDRVRATLFPVTVWFRQQFLGDGEAYARRAAEFSDRTRRELRAEVIDTLKALSQASVEASQEEVSRLVEDERIQSVQWHWIVNGFSCLATKKGLEALQSVPGVSRIFLARGRRPAAPPPEREAKVFGPVDRAEHDPARYKHPWYARSVLADKVWKRLGVTGSGTLNIIMDGNFVFSGNVTGNLYRNPNEVPGNGVDEDGNGLVDDYHGFNFRRGDAVLDVGSGSRHGFMCSAIICGAGTDSSEYEFGLAPDAQWAGVIGGAEIEPAVEWAIEHGADTFSMSFSMPGLGEYRSHWRKVMEHGSFCGVCFVSGAGNFARENTPSYAPVPVQMRTPEDIPNAVFAAAGVQRNLRRTRFSSQGPVEWNTEHYQDGLVQKPAVCAFNMGLPSLRLDGTVTPSGMSGNSFAGPMLCGTLALMLSADPDLLPWDAREILTATAMDVGPEGVDYQTGHGLINSYRAVKEVLRRKAVRDGGDPSAYEGREDDDVLDPDALRDALENDAEPVFE